MADLTVNSIAVKEYLNHKTNKPVSGTELMDFWKSCSTEERQQFADESRSKLLGA